MTAMGSADGPFVGRSVLRLEDPPLLRGVGAFAADLTAPGMVHLRIVRSPVARGRIEEIDIGDALEHPGVVAIYTAADTAHLPPIAFRQEAVETMLPYRQPVLADGYVRYVGEPVAAILAVDPYVAEDAEDLIWIDIEEQDPLLDPVCDRGAFDDQYDNVAANLVRGYGDVDEALAAAPMTLELELRVGRHSGVPMETRGGLAVPGDDGVLRLLGAAKVPHYNQSAICKMLGLDRDKLVLSEGHVGGGFGVRGELYPEDVLMCFAALEIGRPVKWVEDRREHLVAANHSRDQLHRVRVGFDETGFITVVDDHSYLDQGAYVRTHAGSVPNVGMAMLPGPYVWPAYRIHCDVVLTNKTPAGTYRAPGRYEGTFVRERVLDAVADRVGLDPIAVRRRNLIRADQMPFTRPMEGIGGIVILDTGDYAGQLDKVLQRWDLDKLRADARAEAADHETIGVGLAMFVEKSGPRSEDSVRIELAPDSTVRVITGVGSVGQGVETVIAQICADELGVDVDGISVIHGQTDLIARGMGVFGSRVTVLTGTATYMAAGDLRRRLVDIVAERTGHEAERIRLADGCLVGPDGVPLGTMRDLLAELDEPMVANATYQGGAMTYPYGVHIAVVAVDAETGKVEVRRLCVAYDVGRAVNPMLVRGQIEGGAAQGIGGALYEDFTYDENAQPTATSFLDYLLPTLHEMPVFEVMITEDAPSVSNPLGVKGAGEGGTTAAGAAIAAAIDDAIGRPIAITSIPATPERVLTSVETRIPIN